jgi:hypothetical protein
MLANATARAQANFQQEIMRYRKNGYQELIP